ncbi:glycosyltransferase [Nostoc punctiforme]|uniref:Glycosyl transferase, group 1 n=1 Tax=Nostoc punctiforme (strain ATCC 29133 / PCC 73102) TaxID=63737 RepID=B2IYJ1_NOSP7|nr:glycosyltransferase [Nostoc punctiforme]ACC80078.1 glycosyl transferase, group 1 [Nostoc punctiforme PCC 73102]
MRKKIVFIIRDLGYGGAQRQLITLVKNLDKQIFNTTVIFFYANGSLQKDLENNNIQTICLEKRGRWDIFGFLWRLMGHLKRIQPDSLHGYLSESNLLTIFLKPFFLSTSIIWGIRDSNISLDSYDWLDRLIFEIECLLSRFVDLIIVNSHAGQAYHLSHGFPAKKMVVIPNGIDTERFQPNSEAGLRVRTEWRISKDTILIGLIGRLDPMKDHPTFLKAVALLCKERENVCFVCVGIGTHEYAQELYQLAEELEVAEKVIWAGGRADMPDIYNALDITCSSSSYGEGFSNVIGEAMACGVPCVVTDVGDSAWIIDDTGIVVPPNNPEALKAGITSLINIISSKSYSSCHIRQRIISHFSVLNLSLKTQNSLLSINVL